MSRTSTAKLVGIDLPEMEVKMSSDVHIKLFKIEKIRWNEGDSGRLKKSEIDWAEKVKKIYPTQSFQIIMKIGAESTRGNYYFDNLTPEIAAKYLQIAK